MALSAADSAPERPIGLSFRCRPTLRSWSPQTRRQRSQTTPELVPHGAASSRREYSASLLVSLDQRPVVPAVVTRRRSRIAAGGSPVMLQSAFDHMFTVHTAVLAEKILRPVIVYVFLIVSFRVA